MMLKYIGENCGLKLLTLVNWNRQCAVVIFWARCYMSLLHKNREFTEQWNDYQWNLLGFIFLLLYFRIGHFEIFSTREVQQRLHRTSFNGIFGPTENHITDV